VLALALACPVPATQWAPREVGVSAVDPRTGAVLWEAWEERDLPAGSSRAVRDAFRDLLAKREVWDPEAASTGFPLQLAADRVVTYAYDSPANEHRLTLSAGTVDRPGVAIARFSFGNLSVNYERGGETLYVLVDGVLQALKPGVSPHEETWRPAWSFDLSGEPGDHDIAMRLQPRFLHADAQGLWISDHRRVRRLSSDGNLEFIHEIRSPVPPFRDGFGAPLTIGASCIYYRNATGVLAIDRASGGEVWRVPTWRSPYPSRVAEVEDLVLIQVGSDCPSTIRGALAEGAHPSWQLGRNTPRRRVAAAMLLKSYGDGYPRAALRKWIERVRKQKPGGETSEAAAAIELLLQSWPASRDRQRLIDACVDSLLAVSKRNAYGSPATERLLVWCLLQELIYRRAPDGDGRPGINYSYDSWDEDALALTESRRLALARHCRLILGGGPEEEKGFAASVLLSRAVGWDSLGDAELRDLFLSPHESVWRWTGMALAKHGRRDELVALAGRRSEGELLSVIYILDHALPAELSSAEQQFWLACARRTPASIAYVLILTMPKDIPIVYREPICEGLEATVSTARGAETAASQVTSQREYDLIAALRVLHRWCRPEDTPLIAAYLDHPNAFVRGHVKVLLEERGSN
jgi:hypothetical protein